jgi:hypothetical protein
MTEKRAEDMVHEALEGGGGVTQTKGHDQKLIVALMSVKRRSWECRPLSYVSGDSPSEDQVW